MEAALPDEAVEPQAGLAARGRHRLVGLVRAVPIRWRILSIAALNSAVVVVLAAMIWNGAAVLGSAWGDVRQVRESDKILALLESETSRLQNLIHRYINQPSPEFFAEILLLREAVAIRRAPCCRRRTESTYCSLRTSLDASGSPSANNSDTDFGAQNVASNPGIFGAPCARVRRSSLIGSRDSNTRPNASASTSSVRPSRAALWPVHSPGASFAPV